MLTLWQAHSSLLWNCEGSDPVQSHSAPSGTSNQFPHVSLTNHPSVSNICRICTDAKLEIRIKILNTRIIQPCNLGWSKLHGKNQRAVVCPLCLSVPHVPMLSKVMHQRELLLLLIHLGGFTGNWYWSVNQACAQEYHPPHQATVRRHPAQQLHRESDFDVWIFKLYYFSSPTSHTQTMTTSFLST